MVRCIWLNAHMSYLLKTKDDYQTKLSLISHRQLNHIRLFQNAMVTLQGH